MAALDRRRDDAAELRRRGSTASRCPPLVTCPVIPCPSAVPLSPIQRSAPSVADRIVCRSRAGAATVASPRRARYLPGGGARAARAFVLRALRLNFPMFICNLKRARGHERKGFQLPPLNVATEARANARLMAYTQRCDICLQLFCSA